ncbi:MAG: sufurtransferase FdhD [Symbiobacterium thermophilum]|uniref:Formate dehydrogenase associated protein n=2 Tax=Symbiobacterium thermophilum TaxID=2734 RepID=Q67JS0_SYMTH|nr:sufurtransferase FdhD [Symbiobacterium thermophilum]BAD42080.1 formate dehydrogenase associated protein [Symbiobacterium thermophilum IAM 14863]
MYSDQLVCPAHVPRGSPEGRVDAIAAMVTTRTAVQAPVERRTALFVNGQAWLTAQTTPHDLADWAVGRLCGEGLIAGPEEIAHLAVDEAGPCVHAVLPRVRTPAPPAPVAPGPRVAEAQLLRWMQEMLAQAPLYRATGGMHVAMAVRADSGEQIVREDIGRHQAVDKVLGAARLAGWPPAQVVVLTSGRISAEMCARVARFGAPVCASRTAATDEAWALATRLGMDLVGYVRTAASLIVYTTGNRVARRIEP